MRQPFLGRFLRILLRAYLILFAVLVIAPLLWTVYSSFKTNQEFFQNPGAAGQPAIQNYITAWNKANIGKYFFNSVIVTGIVVTANALLGSMTAYACTRLRLKCGRFTTLFYMVYGRHVCTHSAVCGAHVPAAAAPQPAG